MATDTVRPRTAWLNVNRVCNMRCDWCYSMGTGYAKRDDMPLDLAIRLIEMLLPLGVKSVTLIGGEPTLWNPLFTFARFATDYGIKTTLVSNGTRFGEDSFWISYQESPCSSISLSIKGFDEASFTQATDTSSYSVTKQGLERALSRAGSGASFVYVGDKPEDLIHVARFASECGAKSFAIGPSTPMYIDGKADGSYASTPSQFVKGLMCHYDELHDLFNGALCIAPKLPLCLFPEDFIIRLVERSQITTTCQLQHRSGLVFNTDGTLISCNSLHDFPIGVIDKDYWNSESLQNQLNSSPVTDFYSKVDTYASSKCVRCSIRSFCGGGCPLVYSIYNGEHLISGWD